MRHLDGRGRDIHEVELVGQRFDDDAGVLEATGNQPLAQRGARDLQPARAKVRDCRDGRHFDLLFGGRFHRPEQAVLARFGQRNRRPSAAGPPRSADAMHVCVGRGRYIVIDDV